MHSNAPTDNPAAQGHKPTQVVIHIDKKEYKSGAEELTGAQLRTLADPDIGAQFDLWLEVPGKEDEKIGDDETVELKNGMHFFSAPRQINPGRC
jgi:hypothetical protein